MHVLSAVSKDHENMGEVAIVYSIMPESTDVNLGELKDNIVKTLSQIAKVKGTAEKPVAFGLNAIHVMILLDDKKGGTEVVENALANIKGVQSVDVVEMSLV